MPLLDLLRIDAAILKGVQEGCRTRDEIAERVGADSFSQDLEDAIARLKTLDLLVEDSGVLELGNSAETEEIDRKIDEIGPFGTELLNQLASSRVQSSHSEESVIVQDIGVNPTETFIRWYYCEEWRLIKFLMLRNCLDSAQEVFESISGDAAVKFALYHWKNVYGTDEGYVHSTFKRGILNEMRNTVFLYCEDLGGLICAVRTAIQGHTKKFTKRFLHYDSRSVDDLYSNQIPDLISAKKDNEVRELLSYPKTEDQQFQGLDSDQRERFNGEIERSVKLFKEAISDIADFYNEHKDSFLQYKHGNKNFFKPLQITSETLARLREGEDFTTIAYPRRTTGTPLEELDLPEDRLVMGFHEVDVGQLDEVAHKIHWLIVLIINNLIRAYYPNHYREQIFFLKDRGWEFEGTDRYSVAVIAPNIDDQKSMND